MGREIEILAMLADVLQKQDKASEENGRRFDRIEARLDRLEYRLDRLEERFDHLETRVGNMDERFNKVEWRHDDLTLKHEELRYSLSQAEKLATTVLNSVAALTQAVSNMVAQQTQNEARIRRLERPDDFGPNSAAA